MATNRNDYGSDMPSRQDIYESEREDNERTSRYNRTEDRVSNYLRSRPSTSWAEAEYNSRKKGGR